jgi:quinol monooxygenase YgiN
VETIVELYSFVKFQVAAGQEGAAEDPLRSVLAATRTEPGCVSIHAFQGIREPQVFYIHSHWKSEEAFEAHAKLPHTIQFLQTMDTLIDQPREVMRTRLFA